MFDVIRNCQTIFQSVWTILPSHQHCCSTFLSAFGILIFFLSNSNSCVVISHCAFNCISLMANDIELLFKCLFASFISSGKTFYSNTLPFLIRLLIFLLLKLFIYSGYKPFLHMWFGNILSQCITCLFNFLRLFYAEQSLCVCVCTRIHVCAFSKITSFRFTRIKRNFGQEIGVQDESPQKVKLSLPFSNPGMQNVSSISPPHIEGKYAHQCTPMVWKPPGTHAGGKWGG